MLTFFSNFLQEKLKERIEVVPKEFLPQRFAESTIPESLGGTLKVDHLAWLNKCLMSYSQTVAENSTCNGGPRDYARHSGGISRSVESSTFDQEVGLRNEGACTVMEFIEHMMKLQRKGIKLEFVNLRRQSVGGNFQSARQVHVFPSPSLPYLMISFCKILLSFALKPLTFAHHQLFSRIK